jgi:serine protease AprX
MSVTLYNVEPTFEKLDVSHELTGRGVTIAFLDSGFYPHPDLVHPENRILAYVDIDDPGGAISPEAEPEPHQWHGTQTSVVAAGNGLLSEGLYRGLAPEANVVLVRIGTDGRISDDDIARGLRWVVENKDRYGIRIVNVSCGGDEHLPVSESVADQAAEEAVRAGIVVVVAAGNSGHTEEHLPVPPANAPSVITVGGCTTDGLYCSNWGSTADGLLKPEIVAPAARVPAPILPNTPTHEQARELVEIVETSEEVPDEVAEQLAGEKIIAPHYQHVDGTSFAAPIVSSVVAQMLQANPDLTPQAVKTILTATADRLEDAPLIRQGHGIVNPRRAVEAARG